MSPSKWFDLDAELQKLRSTPPKAPKPPKVESEGEANFSHFSHFRWGTGPESQNSAHCTPEVSPPDEVTLATLATLGGVQVQNRVFHTDIRDLHSQVSASWLCPHCGREAVISDVDFSTDGERRLTFWSCAPCQIVAVTPSDIKQPPTGWVKRAEQ